MLGNLDTALRSRLEAINLVALFKSALLTDYSYSLSDILKPFVDGLKELNTVSLMRLHIVLISFTFSLEDGQLRLLVPSTTLKVDWWPLLGTLLLSTWQEDSKKVWAWL